MSKNIIILQHIDIETPGYILDLMKRDNFNLTTIELDEGDKIPHNLEKFDGMFCMGGPMDTWMENDYPWLIDEKKKIIELGEAYKKLFLTTNLYENVNKTKEEYKSNSLIEEVTNFILKDKKRPICLPINTE